MSWDWGKNLALSVASVPSLFLMLELGTWASGLADRAPLIAARVAPSKKTIMYDPAYGYRLRPGTTVFGGRRWINSRGFLARPGEETSLKKEDGVVRILCIGDSRTWGVARVGASALRYQIAYPEVLGTLLRARDMRIHTEVINAGVYGYTSEQGRRYLQLELLNYEPDIISVFYGFNDLLARRAVRGQNWLDTWLQHDAENAYERWLQDLVIGSRFYRVAFHLGAAARRRLASSVRPGERKKVPILRYHLEAPRRQVPAHRYAQNLRQIIQSARKDGADVVFIFAPIGSPGGKPKEAVSRVWQGGGFASYSELTEEYERYEAVMARVAAAHEVPVVDVSQEFAARAGPLFSAWDIVHPLKAGQRIIGQALYRTVRPMIRKGRRKRNA